MNIVEFIVYIACVVGQRNTHVCQLKGLLIKFIKYVIIVTKQIIITNYRG